jgi:UDPglucose--hexose-1-phosphate uridylyltransferase
VLIEPPTEEELESCPFCGGREDRTPPETLRVGDPWLARAVPNLYPAFDRQEVVVHGQEHVRTFAELPDEVLPAIAEAWARRSPDFEHMHVLINEGRTAGASLPHSHSQLVSLPEPPPASALEQPNLAAAACAICTLLRDETCFVAQSRDVVALAHPAGRTPYELLIAPRRHEPDGVHAGETLVSALHVLRDCIRRLRAVEGPVPWNAWLHNGGHWHLEVLPRLTTFAGIELGAGLYVVTVAPETAAAALRGAEAG